MVLSITFDSMYSIAPAGILISCPNVPVLISKNSILFEFSSSCTSCTIPCRVPSLQNTLIPFIWLAGVVAKSTACGVTSLMCPEPITSPFLRNPLSTLIPSTSMVCGFRRSLSVTPINVPLGSITSFPSTSSEVIAPSRSLRGEFFSCLVMRTL